MLGERMGIVALRAGVLGLAGAVLFVPGVAAADLYWASVGTGSIGKADLDGTGINKVFIDPDRLRPRAVAVTDTHIYWTSFTDSSPISRAKLDGSDVRMKFITGLDTAIGVAVTGTHIYWADNDTNQIGRARLDGTGVDRSFISGAHGPYHVFVNDHHIYWTNRQTAAIGRARLDGSDVDQEFIRTGPTPLGIWGSERRLYWINRGLRGIGRADLDGSAVEQDFITGLDATADDGPVGLTGDDRFLYWGNMRYDAVQLGRIGRATLAGDRVTEDFITGLREPHGVAAHVPGTWRAKVIVKAVAGRDALRVDVNPSLPGDREWRFAVQQKRNEWRTLSIRRTNGAEEIHTADLEPGKYRVVIEPQRGYPGVVSDTVTLKR